MMTGHNRPPARPRRIFATITVLGVIAATAAAALLACEDDADDVQANPSASVAPTDVARESPTASPTPHPLQGFVPGEIKPVEQAPDVDFPPDTAMVVATTSDHGHGGFWRIRRIWRLGNGPVEQDEILLPLFTEGQANVTAITAAPSGRLFASVCLGETCYLEGGPKPEVTTRFLASDDGGVTWRDIAEAVGEWWLGAVLDDTVLASRLDVEREWRTFPGGDPLTPPGRAADRPVPVAFSGGFAWVDPELPRLMQPSGTSRLKLDLPIESRIEDSYLPDRGLDQLFVWHMANDSSAGPYIGRFELGGPPHTVLDFTGIPSNPRLGAWLDESRFVAAMEYERDAQCTTHGRTSGSDPVIIDFETATYAFIHDPFYDPHCSTGHHRVVSVMTGPLARVDTPGDCLNLREQPSPDAPVIACLPHGTLVRNEGTVWHDQWTDVTAADGREGWASIDYLDAGP